MAVVIGIDHLNIVESQYDASPYTPGDVKHKHQATLLRPARRQGSVSWSQPHNRHHVLSRYYQDSCCRSFHTLTDDGAVRVSKQLESSGTIQLGLQTLSR